MSLSPRTAAVLAALALGATLVPAAALAASDDEGLSTPREDSYYPRHGDPGVDALHYGLDLRWDPKDRLLSGVADVRLRATVDAPSFQLDLSPALTVRRVLLDGEPVEADHRGSVLSIRTPVTADARYDLRVAYRGTPRPVAAPTTRSDQEKLGLRVMSDGELRTMQEPFGALTWYPVNDQPSDKALYDVRVTVPRPWVGISNGRLLERTRGEHTTTTRFRLQHPTASYLMTLAAGPYVLRRDRGPAGLPLLYWLPRGEVGRYLPTLQHLPDDLRWLVRRLGPYPFESAGVVMVPGQSAMETQTMITFGRGTWAAGAPGREVMVHELVHQWYGDSVTPSDWSDLWLNEGMALYLQGRWTADHGGQSWAAWRSWFTSSNRWDRLEQGGPGAYHRGMFATSCVYFCTSAMYERLRHRIGDQAFWQIVRRWPQSRPDTNADRTDFERFVEQRTGEDLTDFFHDWLDSPVWPPE